MPQMRTESNLEADKVLGRKATICEVVYQAWQDTEGKAPDLDL